MTLATVLLLHLGPTGRVRSLRRLEDDPVLEKIDLAKAARDAPLLAEKVDEEEAVAVGPDHRHIIEYELLTVLRGEVDSGFAHGTSLTSLSLGLEDSRRDASCVPKRELLHFYCSFFHKLQTGLPHLETRG
jgi:hypothetical protein